MTIRRELEVQGSLKELPKGMRIFSVSSDLTGKKAYEFDIELSDQEMHDAYEDFVGNKFISICGRYISDIENEEEKEKIRNYGEEDFINELAYNVALSLKNGDNVYIDHAIPKEYRKLIDSIQVL